MNSEGLGIIFRTFSRVESKLSAGTNRARLYAIAETINSEEADGSTPDHALQTHAAEPTRLSAAELMAHGESRTVEFKSSARWNLHTGDRDQAIEREIVKAVAGFMNAHGGILLIGVNDDREAIGLENDYKLCRKSNRDPRDSFENWLTDLFGNSIGKPALASVSISFESVDNYDICRVEVRPSRQPVYMRGKQTMDFYFYVRLNNGTRSFNIEEAVAYSTFHSS